MFYLHVQLLQKKWLKSCTRVQILAFHCNSGPAAFFSKNIQTLLEKLWNCGCNRSGGGHFVPSPLFRKRGLPVLEPSRIIILSIALGLCLLFRGSLGATWANGKNTFRHDIGHNHRGGKYFIRYMGPSSRSYSCGTIMTSPLLSAYRDWHTSRTCNRIWQEYMHFVVPEKII